MPNKLKPSVKQLIKGDQELQLKIAKKYFKKNIITVVRWVKGDHPLLVTPEVLEIIREHEGFSKEEELTEVVEEEELTTVH